MHLKEMKKSNLKHIKKNSIWYRYPTKAEESEKQRTLRLNFSIQIISLSTAINCQYAKRLNLTINMLSTANHWSITYLYTRKASQAVVGGLEFDETSKASHIHRLQVIMTDHWKRNSVSNLRSVIRWKFYFPSIIRSPNPAF